MPVSILHSEVKQRYVAATTRVTEIMNDMAGHLQAICGKKVQCAGVYYENGVVRRMLLSSARFNII